MRATECDENTVPEAKHERCGSMFCSRQVQPRLVLLYRTFVRMAYTWDEHSMDTTLCLVSPRWEECINPAFSCRASTLI
jgi:hypothetical protein